MSTNNNDNNNSNNYNDNKHKHTIAAHDREVKQTQNWISLSTDGLIGMCDSVGVTNYSGKLTLAAPASPVPASVCECKISSTARIDISVSSMYVLNGGNTFEFRDSRDSRGSPFSIKVSSSEESLFQPIIYPVAGHELTLTLYNGDGIKSNRLLLSFDDSKFHSTLDLRWSAAMLACSLTLTLHLPYTCLILTRTWRPK